MSKSINLNALAQARIKIGRAHNYFIRGSQTPVVNFDTLENFKIENSKDFKIEIKNSEQKTDNRGKIFSKFEKHVILPPRSLEQPKRIQNRDSVKSTTAKLNNHML